MDYKQIQELIKTINKSNISEITVKDGEFEISIKQGGVTSMAPMMQSQPMAAPMQQYQAPATQPQAAAPAASTESAAPAPQPSGGKGQVIKSPMIGTFYRSPSPDKPAFVNVGDEVKQGQVLCIIEAMKLFNEIEAEVSGRLVRVLADDASPVEYDQPLFEIEPA